MCGGVGLVFGAAVRFLVPEPERKAEYVEEFKTDEFVEQVEKPNLLTCFKDLLKRPVSRYLTVAASFRNIINMVCDYFFPLYFLSRFPMYKVEFSLIYGISNMLIGVPSVMLGGILADKFGEKAYTRIC